MILLMVPLLAACLPSRSRHVAESFAEPTSVVTIGTSLAINSLDPASGDPGSELIATNLFEAPLRAVADSGAVAAEAAACSFQDQTTYVCSLVPGQAFSNGDPVTAQDVVFSIRRAIRLGGQDADDLFAPMTSLVAVGNTVTFRLSAPDPTWPLALASSYAGIVDRRVLPKAKVASNADVVGSGPYQVSATAADGSLTFTPNLHYGGSDHLNNARIVLKPAATDEALVSDLAARTIDVAAPIHTSGVWTALRAVTGTTPVAGPLDAIRFLGFDEDSMPGNGPDHRLAIRKAVGQAMDPIGVLNLIPEAARPFGTVGPSDRGDLAAATSTLDTAGVTTPVEMTLVYNADRLADSDLATALQSELNTTALFKVTLQDVPWTKFQDGVASGKYGVYLYGSDQSRRIAQLQNDASIGGLLLPILQPRVGAVARNVVSGLDKAIATPGELSFWNLGKRSAE